MMEKAKMYGNLELHRAGSLSGAQKQKTFLATEVSSHESVTG